MSEIWVTSDTHFNHKNIMNFTDYEGNKVRNFSSVEEMNEVMIERWNSVVKPSDKIYHLGDVFFGPKEWIESNWKRLNGRKRLIVGNHDDIDYIVKAKMFEKVTMWRRFDEFGLLFTHVPVAISTLFEGRREERRLVNVFGHIHSNKPPAGPYTCVCVEQTNYTPVNISELKIN